jgi:hypothetical protein
MRPGYGNDNEEGESEENTQGAQKATGKGKGTKDGKGKRKDKGKGNGKGKGIVKRTPEQDDFSFALPLQLLTQMSDADLDKEEKLERVYSEPEASPTVSKSSDNDTDSTECDGEYDLECDYDVDVRMEDDVDAPDGVNLDGGVDMDRDSEDEKDEVEEDEKEEDGKEEEVVDEDEEEDQDEDNGKEPRTIGQGEIVNPSTDDADTMVDIQPTVLHEKGQEMSDHTPCPQPRSPSPQQQTPEPRARPHSPETHTLSGLELLGLVKLHNAGQAARLL